MARLDRIDIYEIGVNPNGSIAWEGKFNFKPNAIDVEAAIRAEIAELDPEVEHEYDLIQSLYQTLELVTFHQPELLGEVKIAGTLVGKISIAPIKVFGLVEESAMPPITKNTTGENF